MSGFPWREHHIGVTAMYAEIKAMSERDAREEADPSLKTKRLRAKMNDHRSLMRNQREWYLATRRELEAHLRALRKT